MTGDQRSVRWARHDVGQPYTPGAAIGNARCSRVSREPFAGDEFNGVGGVGTGGIGRVAVSVSTALEHDLRASKARSPVLIAEPENACGTPLGFASQSE